MSLNFIHFKPQTIDFAIFERPLKQISNFKFKCNKKRNFLDLNNLTKSILLKQSYFVQ